jgi:hypothetical protein
MKGFDGRRIRVVSQICDRELLVIVIDADDHKDVYR